MQPVGHHEWGPRRRRGHDKLALAHHLFGAGADLGLNAQRIGQVGGAGGGLRLVAAPDEKAGEWPDDVRGLHLQPRLNPGADHAGRLDRLGCKKPRGHRAGCGGADVGQVAVVEEHRLHQPGPGREQDHQSIERGQADPGIVEEPRRDLDRKAIEAGDPGGLDVDLAMRFGKFHRQDRRHHHRPRGERGKSLFDHVDGFEVEPHDAAQLGLGHDADVMRHRASP